MRWQKWGPAFLLWLQSFLAMNTARERIDALVWTIAASGYDSIEVNTIGVGFGRIKRDLTYLEITDADCRLAAAKLRAASEAVWQSAQGKVGTWRPTPEEIALEEEHHRLAHVLHLRIDTLYFVGSRLLNGVVAAADLLLTPSRGRPRGLKNLERHHTVKARLEERIQNGLAPPAPPALFSAIDEVTERIKDHRDHYVAHPAPPAFPEMRPTVSIGPAGHVAISKERASEVEATDGATDLLARYVNVWLDYLESVPLPSEWTTLQRSPRATGQPSL
jgi:hypothetical protein